MAIATEVTTLELSSNKAKLPLGALYHKHVVFVEFLAATSAEIKWSDDEDGTNLYAFGDVLSTSGESIVHEGIAPKGGSLWLVTNGTCTTIKHYAYDRRHLRGID